VECAVFSLQLQQQQHPHPRAAAEVMRMTLATTVVVVVVCVSALPANAAALPSSRRSTPDLDLEDPSAADGGRRSLAAGRSRRAAVVDPTDNYYYRLQRQVAGYIRSLSEAFCSRVLLYGFVF